MTPAPAPRGQPAAPSATRDAGGAVEAPPRVLQSPDLRAGWSWTTRASWAASLTPPSSRRQGLGAAVPALRWVRRSLSSSGLGRDHLGDPASPTGDAWSQQGGGPREGARAGHTRERRGGAAASLHPPPTPRWRWRAWDAVSSSPRTRRTPGPGPHEGRGGRAPVPAGAELGRKREWNPGSKGYCLASHTPRLQTFGDTCHLGLDVPKESTGSRESTTW